MAIKATRPGGGGNGRGDNPHGYVFRYKAHIFPEKTEDATTDVGQEDWTPPQGIKRPKL